MGESQGERERAGEELRPLLGTRGKRKKKASMFMVSLEELLE